MALREVVVVAVHAAHALDPLEHLAHESARALQAERDPAEQPQPSAAEREPVDEEDDVPRLLLEDRFELRDESHGELTRAPRDREQAEGEERVHALAVAHAQELVLHVGRRLLGAIGRDRVKAVFPDEGVDQLRVPRLLVALERDDLAQLGIGLAAGIRGHEARGRVLGAERLVPDRQGAEALERLGIELGPANVGGLEGEVRRAKLADEEVAVLERAADDPGRRASGQRRKRDRKGVGAQQGNRDQGKAPPDRPGDSEQARRLETAGPARMGRVLSSEESSLVAAWENPVMSLIARVRAALPDTQWEHAAPARVASADDPARARERLARHLAIELDGCARTLVLLNDESRATSPELAATLVRAALAASREVSVLFARGSHALEGAPLAEHADRALARLSSDERARIPVAHHDARDAGSLAAHAGAHWNRAVLEADKVLALGSVEPHYFAGWTGAHKTATIGVLGLESIEASHRHALEPDSRVLALDGNPVFDGIAALATSLGDRLTCVNEVLVGGERLAQATGPWRSALEQVLPAARLAFVRDLEDRVDLLVAQVASPLGRNLYQAEKGVKNSEDAVRDGGSVVLVAGCEDGLGPARFLDALARARTHREAREQARAAYRLGDHKAVKVRALEARGVEWHLVCPGVGERPDAVRIVTLAGLRLHDSLDAALAAIRTRSNPGRALLVEDAGNLVATVVEP